MATIAKAKPWRAEYAKSSRSSCKTCKIPIDKENLRLGKMVQAPFDGLMPMWNHASCVLKKANQIKSPDDVEGMDLLRLEDQQKIKKYISVSSSSTDGGYDNECIEVSRSSRAACRLCSRKIMKGEVRVSIQPEGQDARGLAWHHTSCFMESSPSTQVEKLSGWESLSSPDQEVVRSSVKQVSKSGVHGSKSGSKAIGGSKRKSAASGGPKPKSRKSEGNASLDNEPTRKNKRKI